MQRPREPNRPNASSQKRTHNLLTSDPTHSQDLCQTLAVKRHASRGLAQSVRDPSEARLKRRAKDGGRAPSPAQRSARRASVRAARRRADCDWQHDRHGVWHVVRRGSEQRI
jgi:hypothetical protein